MTPRILVNGGLGDDSSCAGMAEVSLDDRQRHYLTKVLRLGDGARVEIFDGQGRRWAARLRSEAGRTSLIPHERLSGTPESPISIHLGQCLSSADKMDWTVEKAVELGATAVTPLFSNRSAVRLDETRARRKSDHWRAIAEAACMQSGRDVMPAIAAPQPLSRWIERLDTPIRLVLDPRSGLALSAWQRSAAQIEGAIGLLAGPESGLDDSELAAARRAGFTAVRLGPRVLRTETAGLAAVAALQALAGDY